ncbi:MAG: hypothetical protein AYP45_17125 [Candidatus Brocadia carolinensis]|uniref:Flagellar protein n=1 Tax=Candidatus Brocadia carolinensis TaxID=1004156 RepID=A0A1V4API9_9BACT|nr:MAG: hypothetical protein AYP45_17125 [Candidatus Brocadia caroliniensis]
MLIIFLLLVTCSTGYCVPGLVEKEEIYGTATAETDSAGVSSPINFPNITKVIKVLGLIIITIIGVVLFLRKKFGINSSLIGRKRHIHIVDSAPLGSKKYVHLVKIPGKILLIGVTNERIQSLSEITEKEIVDSVVSESKGNEFMSIFKRARTGH